MKQGRISQTALKVANSLVSLSAVDDWAQRLPAGLVEMSERLLVASGSPGYGPRLMELSKGPWMIRAWRFQDLIIPGQSKASVIERSTCNNRWRPRSKRVRDRC